MAHQAHALPWNTLASHFKYYFSCHSNPQRFDIYPLQKPTQTKELSYFAKVFSKQIQEFSNTERAKYESQVYFEKRATKWTRSVSLEDAEKLTGRERQGQIETRMVISNELIDRYSDPVLGERYAWTFHRYSNPSKQKVEHWLRESGSIYDTEWGEEADVIKILMMEAAGASPALSASSISKEVNACQRRQSTETLLLMANHPQIPLLSLKNLHWGHHFGISRVAEEAVKSYVYLNLIYVMKSNGSDVCDPVLESSEALSRMKYMDCRSYITMLGSVACTYDMDAHTLPHREFFLAKPCPKQDIGVQITQPKKDVLGDMDELKEYLKGVWRIMVTYDLIIREEGGDPDWEGEFKRALWQMFSVRLEEDN